MSIATRLAVLTLAAALGATPLTAQQRAGGEFVVNGFTAGRQSEPAVARSADGDFVVVWSSGCSPVTPCTGQDGDGFGVFGRRYDASGNPRTFFEFQVNVFTTGDQRDSAVAMSADGSFVVVWKSWGQIGPWEDIVGRRFDASGNPIGGEFQVSSLTTTRQIRPAVAIDEDGAFVVVWNADVGGPGLGLEIHGRRYDASGTPLASEFRVNTDPLGSRSSPDVAMNADGRFVATWDKGSVQAQIYDSSGVPVGGQLAVSTLGSGDTAVAMDAEGNFVVAFSRYVNQGDVLARRVDAGGTPIGAEFTVNSYTTNGQSIPDVAMDADGDFVVTWNSYDQDGSSGGIFGQEYQADGTPRGEEFQVNTYTYIHQLTPAVAVDADGDSIIVWQGYQPNQTHDVLGQRYAGPGLFLSIAGACPGTVEATILNGPPNAEVAVVAAANDNGFVKAGALCPGTELAIGEPFQLPPAFVILDADGAGSAVLELEPDRCWVQALAFEGCSTSDTVRAP